MPKKKSMKLAARTFKEQANDTKAYTVAATSSNMSDGQKSRVYGGAVISLYRDFEYLILELLVSAINNDTATIRSTLGVSFPRHLTGDICRYIITGPSYFDFKGRDGLIKRVKQYVPPTHYLVDILKASKYRTVIERLCALRNYSAHGSGQSRKAALESVGQVRIGSAGSWLKRKGRFSAIVAKLTELADEIEDKAPY